MHVALILPAHQIHGPRVRLAKGLVARLVIGVPVLALLGREFLRRLELEVPAVIVCAIVMSCSCSAMPRPE